MDHEVYSEMGDPFQIYVTAPTDLQQTPHRHTVGCERKRGTWSAARLLRVFDAASVVSIHFDHCLVERIFRQSIAWMLDAHKAKGNLVPPPICFPFLRLPPLVCWCSLPHSEIWRLRTYLHQTKVLISFGTK